MAAAAVATEGGGAQAAGVAVEADSWPRPGYYDMHKRCVCPSFARTQPWARVRVGAHGGACRGPLRCHCPHSFPPWSRGLMLTAVGFSIHCYVAFMIRGKHVPHQTQGAAVRAGGARMLVGAHGARVACTPLGDRHGAHPHERTAPGEELGAAAWPCDERCAASWRPLRTPLRPPWRARLCAASPS